MTLRAPERTGTALDACEDFVFAPEYHIARAEAAA